MWTPRHLFGQGNLTSWRYTIQETVIYEKCSIAYVRRILRAWKQTGRAGKWKFRPIRFEPNPVQQNETLDTSPDIVWPPVELARDAAAAPDRSNPSAVAWRTICDRLPPLGRLSRMARAVSFEKGVPMIEVAQWIVASARLASTLGWR